MNRWLIILAAVAVVLVAIFVFTGGDDTGTAVDAPVTEAPATEAPATDAPAAPAAN